MSTTIRLATQNTIPPTDFVCGTSDWSWCRIWAQMFSLSGTSPSVTVSLRMGPREGAEYEVASHTFTTAPAVVKLYEGKPDALMWVRLTLGGTVTAYDLRIYATYEPWGL